MLNVRFEQRSVWLKGYTLTQGKVSLCLLKTVIGSDLNTEFWDNNA